MEKQEPFLFVANKKDEKTSQKGLPVLYYF